MLIGKIILTALYIILLCPGMAGMSSAAVPQKHSGSIDLEKAMANFTAPYFTLRNEIFLEIGDTLLEFTYYDEAQARQWNMQPGLYVTAAVNAVFDGADVGLSHNGPGPELDLGDWRDLEGKRWAFPYDEKNYQEWQDSPAGVFFSGEHRTIKECSFEVLKRDGGKFSIRWKGIADLFWGGDFDTDVPFDCVFEAEFTGIVIPQYVADQTEKGLRENLGAIINLDDFTLAANKFNGIKKFIFKGARYDNWQ